MQRGIAAMGAEFRGDVDFLRDRVRADIQELIDSLLGRPPRPNPPVICKVVPENIDLSQPPTQMTRVTLYGYDFRERSNGASQLRLRGLRRNGQTIDLNHWLALSSHYQGTIAITRDNGRVLRDRSIKEVQVLHENRVLSQIPVNPYIPSVTNSTGALKTFTFMPPKTGGGDDDFWTGQQLGHYSVVRVNLKTEARQRGNTVEARVWMQALEWDRDGNRRSGDRTAAEGWSEWIELYTASAGYRIRRVLTDMEDNPAVFECEKAPVELNRAGRSTGSLEREDPFSFTPTPNRGPFASSPKPVARTGLRRFRREGRRSRFGAVTFGVRSKPGRLRSKAV